MEGPARAGGSIGSQRDQDSEPSRENGSSCYHSGDEESQTPNPCNTGVTNRHSSGGVDTLEVSLYGFWHLSQWSEIRSKLTKARERAESGFVDQAKVVTDENDVLLVEPTGVRKGVHCRFVINWQGCRIAIVDNPAPNEHRLSVWVGIGSIRLMQVGHVEAWQAVLSLLSEMGFEYLRSVVGRVDLCTDHADQSMEEIKTSVDECRTICRARKQRIYSNRTNGNWETYQVGSGPMLLRIYDKALEVRNDPVKLALLIEQRWGHHCDQAIRVEFQLRNKALKRHFMVRTVEELFAAVGTIAKWCSREWFRLVSAFDRKNRNHARATATEFWDSVQQAFKSWTGEARPRRASKRNIVPDFVQLVQQAVGCVTSKVAHSDGAKFLGEWMKLGREALEEAEKAVTAKRLKLAAASRVGPGINESDIPF